MSMNGTSRGAVIVSSGMESSFSRIGSSLAGASLERGEQLVEALEALVPVLAVASEPRRRLHQRRGLQVAEAGRGPLRAGDEPGSLQHLEVAGDRRLGGRERAAPRADG